MLRFKDCLAATLLVVMAGSSVNAGWHEFWDRFHLDTHRNNCWPKPFNAIDARAAKVPFVAMVHSGWRAQNTLGQHYFDREKHTLTEAGKRRLHYILVNSPEQFRTVYLAQAHRPEVFESRMDSIQQTLAEMLPTQDLPAVVAVPLEPRGWPAEYVDTIDRKMQSTIPDPRLPPFQTAGSQGGG